MPRKTVSTLTLALTMALLAAPFAAAPAKADPRFSSEVRAHMKNRPQTMSAGPNREIAMIQLQNMMTQRQTAIQTMQNMQQKMDPHKTCRHCF